MPETKKLMYGKRFVVHESRHFIQARRAVASCYHVDLERGNAAPTTPSRKRIITKKRRACKHQIERDSLKKPDETTFIPLRKVLSGAIHYGILSE